ncbi:hypothetical protein EJ08DRAFT_650209 [Tothia fuscella]|uniref:Uncharacterized protein n=1 Tax=Tothia fuscella TaxID=1048955 RepID=A0A9P4TYC9_9PEZI|nr:hypothetical protein EJ08DRAFT_650209 [Tothia fuscella]
MLSRYDYTGRCRSASLWAFIDFLYFGDYSDDAQTTFRHSNDNEPLKAGSRNAKDIQHAMLFNTEVYEHAVHFQLEHLQHVAMQKFHYAAELHWCTEDFISDAKFVFSATAEQRQFDQNYNRDRKTEELTESIKLTSSTTSHIPRPNFAQEFEDGSALLPETADVSAVVYKKMRSLLTSWALIHLPKIPKNGDIIELSEDFFTRELVRAMGECYHWERW